MTEIRSDTRLPEPVLAALGKMPLDAGMVPKTKTAANPAPDEMSDLLLLVGEQRERKAFIRLFEHFGPRVKSYLRKLGAGESEAEDLMQEVMMTVWTRAHQFDRRKARASTWIFTIARNKRIDAIRRERRPELDPNDPSLIPDRNEDPSDALAAGEQRAVIRKAIESVPEEQARLLRLSFFEDKTHDVIARELNLPLGTVKSRIRLAVAKLRRGLEDCQ